MQSEVRRAVEILRSGGVVAFPTETVYGLGADAENELAVRRIFAVKGRPASHPLIVHVADVATARTWAAAFPVGAEALAARHWPGPLTIVVNRSSRAADVVTGGQSTVGLRVPGHPMALELLRAFGGGLAAPSANRFGQLSPTTAAHVREDLGPEPDLILDGGPCTVGVESTIVDLSSPSPRLLRPGGVPREALEEVLGVPVIPADSNHPVRAPGTLESHYAPRAGLLLTSAQSFAEEAHRHASSGGKVALIVTPDLPTPSGMSVFRIPAEPEEFARALYSTLRLADASGASLIIAVAPSGPGLGAAVRDRLSRAAAPRSTPKTS